MVFERLKDARPGEVLRLISRGATVAEQAARAGVTRQTIARWHRSLEGFAEAAENVRRLAIIDRDDARAELAALLQDWTPGPVDGEPVPPQGLGLGTLLRGFARPSSQEVVEPDVLDSDGRKVVATAGRSPRESESPYTTTRPPTNDELKAILARILEDKSEPERLRAVAIAGLTKLCEVPAVRMPRQVDDAAVVEAARERGRDPGVPASVWQEARQNFLGPAPEPAPEDDKSGDVVEFERPAPSS